MPVEAFDQSIQQAAHFLGLHVRTVQKLAGEGKIRGYRTEGNRWRFRQSDLDRYVGDRINVTEEATA